VRAASENELAEVGKMVKAVDHVGAFDFDCIRKFLLAHGIVAVVPTGDKSAIVYDPSLDARVQLFLRMYRIGTYNRVRHVKNMIVRTVNMDLLRRAARLLRYFCNRNVTYELVDADVYKEFKDNLGLFTTDVPNDPYLMYVFYVFLRLECGEFSVEEVDDVSLEKEKSTEDVGKSDDVETTDDSCETGFPTDDSDQND